MTDPGGVIGQIRRAIRDDGTWFVADIKAQPSYEENVAKNPMAAMMYGTSVLTCMSSALSEPGGLGLGTLGLHAELARQLADRRGLHALRAARPRPPGERLLRGEAVAVPSVLITGTSSGFGLHAAVEVARRGWQVFATMRNLDKRAPLDAALAAAGVADRVRVSRLDVTEPASIETCVRATLQHGGGRLDAVVQNAGVAVGGAFEDVPESEARRVMETNFWGVLGLTRALLPTFRAQRGGRIVIVSSNSAYAGEPANAIYVASKWAIEGWAESLMYEITPFGIELVLVEPGAYKTEIWGSSPRVLPETSPYRVLMQHLEKAIDEKVKASARDPREVAQVIATALGAQRPRFRYPVGPDAWVGHVARGKVPSRAWRFAISRLLGLHHVRL